MPTRPLYASAICNQPRCPHHAGQNSGEDEAKLAPSVPPEVTAGQASDTTFVKFEIATCHKWREVNIKWYI